MAEQKKAIFRLLFTFLLTNYKNVRSDSVRLRTKWFWVRVQLQSLEHLHFPNTFSYFYHEFWKYSSNHILNVYKAANQGVVKHINMFF